MKNNSGLWAKMQMFVNPTIIKDPTRTAHLMMAPDEEPTQTPSFLIAIDGAVILSSYTYFTAAVEAAIKQYYCGTAEEKESLLKMMESPDEENHLVVISILEEQGIEII